MAYKGYDLFYVNGSSYTMGGGLEDAKLCFENEPCREGYKKLYNVSWESTRHEVNYAARLSKLLNIECINEAECGAGLDRTIRMTYEFLENNWDKRHKLFIFLEITDPGRSEIFYNDWNTYFICNTELHDLNFKYATTVYNPKPDGVDELQPIFKDYITKFHNLYEFWKTINRNLIGLYSFCHVNNIPIKFMGSPTYKFYNSFVKSEDVFENHIYQFAKSKNKLVIDDVGDYSHDGHPGYFAHIEYANLLKEWLDTNLEYSKIEKTKRDDFQNELLKLRSRDPFAYE